MENGVTMTQGYAAKSQGAKLELIDIELPALGPTQVEIDMIKCGVCHSDISSINNEWGVSDYPLVAGHEGIGKVVCKGDHVKHLQVGDIVGVGWIRDSCGGCNACDGGHDNLCVDGYRGVYLGKSAGAWGKQGGELFGCFSKKMRVEERFAFKVPDGLDLGGVAPLMCAGTTVWEPILNYVKVGNKVGVVSLGGLGHMAVKLLGCVGAGEIWVFSHSKGKKERAMKLGACRFVETGNKEQMEKAKGCLDVIIDTNPVTKPGVSECMDLLTFGGTYVKVGIPDQGTKFECDYAGMIFTGKKIAGSIVSGTRNTNRLLQVAAARKVESEVEEMPFEKINDAIESLTNGKNKKFRYVLKW